MTRWSRLSVALALALATWPLAASAQKRLPELSGYLQFQYNDTDDSNDDGKAASADFLIKRARVRVKGLVLDHLGYTIMADLSTPQNLLRDAFISWTGARGRASWELRLGQQKTQFGYENPETSMRLYTINRASVSDSYGRGPDLRDLGVGAFGGFKLPRDLALEAAVTVVNGEGANNLDRTNFKNLWGRVGASWRYAPAEALLRVGFSFATGNQRNPGQLPMDPADDFNQNFHRLGVDAELDARWAFVAAEYVAGSTQTTPEGASADGFGWYLLLVPRMPWRAGAGGPLFKVDIFDPDGARVGDALRRYTLGGYFDLEKVNARLIVNYEIDESAGRARRDDVLLVQAQVVF